MRTRSFGSQPEVAAYRILQRVLADKSWIVLKDVALSRVFDKDEYLSTAEFSMFRSGSLDFLVASAPMSIADHSDDFAWEFAVEIDGPGHQRPEQVARDLIKNDFCHRVGLPLLRLRTEHLREVEETSVLEWLMTAYTSSDPDLDEAVLEDEPNADPIVAFDADDAVDDAPEWVIGEPGVEMEHPFPDNALVAERLRSAYTIHVGKVGMAVPEESRYVLEIRWPGRQPPRMRRSPVSEFVVSEREFVVAPSNGGQAMFSGAGIAQFAWAHRLPAKAGAPLEATLAPIDFPWDAWGVAMELAEFSALRQAERWAESNLRPR